MIHRPQLPLAPNELLVLAETAATTFLRWNKHGEGQRIKQKRIEQKHFVGLYNVYPLLTRKFHAVRSPSPGACNYPYSCHGVFTDRSTFSLNLSDPHRSLSDQLKSEARTNVHVRPHCFILITACLCRLEQAYFAGNISKNRLVCKNSVALAYYGSCKLLL